LFEASGIAPPARKVYQRRGNGRTAGHLLLSTLRGFRAVTILARKPQSVEESDMAETNLARQLEELFRETGEAHHQAYIETDGFDPEWPLWYADYLQERLGPFLDANFTKSELVYLLIWVANEQPLSAPGADWARYYARFFITKYT
jgi:hypothetical protein